MGTAHLRSLCPQLDPVNPPCTFRAVKDKGAYLRHGPSENRVQERIKAASFGLQDKGLTIVGSSSHPSVQTLEFIELFNSPEILQVRRRDDCRREFMQEHVITKGPHGTGPFVMDKG